MASRIKDGQLVEAVLDLVIKDSYPDSDDVVGAPLAASALPEIVTTLREARENLYEEVRRVSRQNSTEIDSWVSQARKLHEDIEESRAMADDILKLAREEKGLEQELEDAATQFRFLSLETQLNSTLGEMLSKLQLIDLTLSQVGHLLGNGELCHAIEILGNADIALGELSSEGGIIVVSLMKEKARGLKSALINKAEDCWRDLVAVNPQGKEISICKDAIGTSGHSGETVIDALKVLNILKSKVDQFHHQVDELLIAPRLDLQGRNIPTFSVGNGTLRISGHTNDQSAANMFADLRRIISFFNTNLQPSVIPMFSSIFVPNLTTRLITSSLSSSVPSSLDDLPDFEALLNETRRFEDFLHQISWARETELRDWTLRAPKVWLAKRRESCLDSTRQILAREASSVKVVERVETQKMKIHSLGERSTLAKGQIAGDWDEDPNQLGNKQPTATAASAEPGQIDIGDDEDASGWGLDEDLDIEDEEPVGEAPGNTGDGDSGIDDALDNMDWGEWGEDDEQQMKPQTPTTTVPASLATRPIESQTSSRPPSSHSQDVTLRESYTVTLIPDAILELVIQVVDEAGQLSQLPSTSIASASPGLLSIPTLIFDAYRALAPISYPADISSNMYIYNDCVRISEQLLNLELPSLTPPENGVKDDIDLVLSFGKRHYAKEISSQRTILCDLLDGAQGFLGCTDYPQSVNCETAISSTITRIHEIHGHWSKVLSLSTLSQSLGLLLNTVVTKLVNDIEDMADIPAAESVKLSEFCEEISKLEGLFPEGPGGIPTVAFYCKNWLKFRFLHQILESRIADILYMFREGHLEGFGTDELVDLVKALFADNENRRRCVDEIQRGKI